MLLKEIMRRNPVICTEDTPLERVFELMETEHSTLVTVVENHAHQTPIGTITQRDICAQIVGRGRNPRGLTAANVMNTNVLKLNEETNISACVDLFEDDTSKKVLIVDDNGSLIGSVGRSDIDASKYKHQFDHLAFRPGPRTYRRSSAIGIF